MGYWNLSSLSPIFPAIWISTCVLVLLHVAPVSGFQKVKPLYGCHYARAHRMTLIFARNLKLLKLLCTCAITLMDATIAERVCWATLRS